MFHLAQFFWQVSVHRPGYIVASNKLVDYLPVIGQSGALVRFVMFVRKFQVDSPMSRISICV